MLATPTVLLLDLIAIVGATVHTGVPGQEPAVATVLIEDQNITAVGPALAIPEGARVVEAAGLHLTPGLIDGMVSFDPEHDLLYLSRGITCVRDLGGDASVTALLRSPEHRELTPGPALLTAGAVLDGQPPLSSAALAIGTASDLEQALIALDQNFQVDFLSVQPNFPAELAGDLGERARSAGLPVWGLLPDSLGLSAAVEAGFNGFLGLDVLLPDGVNWTFAQPGAFEANIKVIAEAGVALVPVVGEAERRAVRPDPEDPDLGLLGIFYEAQWLAEWAAREPLLDESFGKMAERIATKRSKLLARLHEVGIPLLPGSGAPLSWVMPGRSLLDELDRWVAAGLPPEEVLGLATRGAAELIGEGERRGTIAPQRVADLVLLASDPREDLSGFREPSAVFVRGRYLDRSFLESGLDDLRQEQATVRERDALPLPVPELELPEGRPLLTGVVETRSLGQRLSAERFAVVAEEDDSISLLSTLVSPPSASIAGKQVEIAVSTRGGAIEGFSIRFLSGEEELILRGVWQAQRMRLQRRLNGEEFATQSTPERPELLSLSPLADTVLAALCLGQIEATERPLVVLELGPELEPVLDRWLVQDVEDGSRWIRSGQGFQQFQFLSNGGPASIYRRTGQQESRSQLRLETLHSFGGAGHPAKVGPPPEVIGPPTPVVDPPEPEQAGGAGGR